MRPRPSTTIQEKQKLQETQKHGNRVLMIYTEDKELKREVRRFIKNVLLDLKNELMGKVVYVDWRGGIDFDFSSPQPDKWAIRIPNISIGLRMVKIFALWEKFTQTSPVLSKVKKTYGEDVFNVIYDLGISTLEDTLDDLRIDIPHKDKTLILNDGLYMNITFPTSPIFIYFKGWLEDFEIHMPEVRLPFEDDPAFEKNFLNELVKFYRQIQEEVEALLEVIKGRMITIFEEAVRRWQKT